MASNTVSMSTYSARILAHPNTGSTTKGIYLKDGKPEEVAYTVNAGTANQVAYYSGANTISSKAPAWSAWTAGTTAGPKANIQIGNATYQSAAIPTATASAAGIITTGNQTWAGNKTFQGHIYSSANATYDIGANANRIRYAYIQSGFFGGTASAAGGVYLYTNSKEYGRLYVATVGTEGTYVPADTTTDAAAIATPGIQGEAILALGNNINVTPTSTTALGANNARGRIRFYGTGTKYIDLIPDQTGTSGSYTQYLPMISGYSITAATTPALTMSTWAAANWNHYDNSYLPTVTAAGAAYTSDTAQLKMRLYAAKTSNGYACIQLGNNIAQGTAKNSYGYIRLYSQSTNYHQILPTSTATAYTHYLPNKTGWIATGGNGTTTGVGGTTRPIYLATNGTLTECAAGTGGQFLRGDYTWTNILAGHLLVYTPTKGYSAYTEGSAIEIREVGLVTSTQSTWNYAPKLGFHWGNRVQGVLGVSSEGYFEFHVSDGTTANASVRAGQIWSAVWNDYAETRMTDTKEPGRVVYEQANGIMTTTNDRLLPGCKVISDTYGTCMGYAEDTPIAVAGRVLVYPYQNKNKYELGAAVCSAPNGTVDIMTREEIITYPERIIGTVSEIPNYEIWYSNDADRATPDSGNPIPVNGRIWIYVK